MTAETMPKAYEPAAVESKWYPEWERRGCFKAKCETGKEPYTIVIPPPNVTGMLTLGHVLNNTLQDILIRFEKMRGRETCWVPGTDHAGIATQSRVEAFLRESENITRHDLGREKFLERVWDWKHKYGSTIINQLRRLGTACDWERERFTLDPGLSKAVEEVFIRLHEKGLIYRGSRIINWCPKSMTALSDEEVIYREEKSHLWHLRYPLSDGSGHLVVATTRPETMLGDTAVAVNPHDERYAALVGKTVTLPLTGREIPVVADNFVDPQFGTGAVKVTPAHDPNDYEIGLRHELPQINVMNDDGSMNAAAGADFAGQDRYACRKAVIKRLEELGLLEKIEDYVTQIGYSERGGVPVEPRLSEQWFVRMQSLAEPALKAVLDGRIRFHPERWVKTYCHWMENIKDWCISRQLWWGHRIPAYYCCRCNYIEVARKTPVSCPVCGAHEFRQEEDVLDTWFSSWLWPFSVFGWPEENADLTYFYPTQSLVTGPDIIFFWVARMIMAGLEFMGDIPFSDVYFTSIIRDDQGRKLSKSLNNSPDPIQVMEDYGTDALRFTMIYIAPVGQDIRYNNEKCEIGRNFANKIWNAARFRRQFGLCSENFRKLDDLTGDRLRPDDRWMLARLQDTVHGVTSAIEQFRFLEYCKRMYEFVWNEFCDWYLESAKAVLAGDDPDARAVILRLYDHALWTFLRLLQPLMPFLTEELVHQLDFLAENESIMDAEWPRAADEAQLAAWGATPALVEQVNAKFDLIRSVRNMKASYGIATNRKGDVIIVPATPEYGEFLRQDLVATSALLYAEKIDVVSEYQDTAPAATTVSLAGTVYMPLSGVIDVAAEIARLRKQETEITGFAMKCRQKLNNEQFVSRAPQEVVAREEQRLAELHDQLQRLQEQIQALAENA